MSNPAFTQTAEQNLREFKEMSYADVYSLIRQMRFLEAREKYSSVLANMDTNLFTAARNLEITTSHDELLDLMSDLAGNSAEPEKISAIGFDLSAHQIYDNYEGFTGQGLELSLFSKDVFDFNSASDEELQEQCEAVSSAWQGRHMDITAHALQGLGEITRQFLDYQAQCENSNGVLHSEQGTAVVDPDSIAYHVAKLLVAIEYHRFMADFIQEVDVPADMTFIVGEHDEIEVPIVFHRVKAEVQPVAQDVMPEGVMPEEMPLEQVVHEEALTATQADDELQTVNEAVTPALDDDAVYGAFVDMDAPDEDIEISHENIAEPSLASVAASVRQNFEVTNGEGDNTPDGQAPLHHDQEYNQEEVTPEDENEPVQVSHSLLGKPLKSKTFGQRTNSSLPDLMEEEQGENKSQADELAG